MSLSTLPDLCLLNIFDRILLQQVNSLGKVCQRWSSLLPIAYKRRRSLILIIALDKQSIEHRFKEYGTYQHNNPFNERIIKPPNEKNKFNFQRKLALLEFSFWNEIDSNWLISTLPNITNLEIIHQGTYVHNPKLQVLNETSQLIDLLSHWSGKLKTLQYSQCGPQIEYSPALSAAFNSMPALKRLWLQANFTIPSKVDLFVLSQLDQFYIFSCFPSLPYQLKKYAPVMSPNLKIAIGHSIHEENALENYCNFNDKLATRIVYCQIYSDFILIGFNLMQGFYSKFTSLTHVAINMRNVTLSQLCLGLSALSNLTRLSMYPSGESGDVKPFSNEDQLPSSNFPPFTSVHTLLLNFGVNSHLDYTSVHLVSIFPAVQWVNARYIYGRCVLCGIMYGRPHLVNIERYEGCFQQLVHPFRMLPKLEQILGRRVSGRDVCAAASAESVAVKASGAVTTSAIS